MKIDHHLSKLWKKEKGVPFYETACILQVLWGQYVSFCLLFLHCLVQFFDLSFSAVTESLPGDWT